MKKKNTTKQQQKKREEKKIATTLSNCEKKAPMFYCIYESTTVIADKTKAKCTAKKKKIKTKQ